MKLGTSPTILENIIKSAMLYDKTPNLIPITLNFNPDSLSISDTYLSFIATIHTYKPSHFIAYESLSPTPISLNFTILDRLSKGFKEDVILAKLDDSQEHLILDSKRDHDEVELVHPSDRPYNCNIKKVDGGYLPDVSLQETSFTIDASELKFPESTLYDLDFNDDILNVGVKEMDKFTRKPVLTRVITNKPITIQIDGPYHNYITKNLSGEILVAIDENVTIYSESSPTHNKIYVLANKEV
jgi:hypothetical protein